MAKINDKTISEIEYDLLGTTQSLAKVCEEHGVKEDDVLAQWTGNVEMCDECGWWCDSSELVAEDEGEVGRCEDCRGGD